MPSHVGPIRNNPVGPLDGRKAQPEAAPGAGQPSFRDLLKNQIERVNVMQQDADVAIENLATGKTENLGEVMTAVEKADLAFKTLMQIRNKLMDAYEEINRMRV